ncbi:hypothetical protein X975_16777, partial [Stegodyphus mimosarum]
MPFRRCGVNSCGGLGTLKRVGTALGFSFLRPSCLEHSN